MPGCRPTDSSRKKGVADSLHARKIVVPGMGSFMISENRVFVTPPLDIAPERWRR